MRITFVLSHAGLAGGVRVVAVYAGLLRQQGHDVTVVSTHYRWPSRRQRLLTQMRRLGRRAAGRPEPSHFRDMEVEHRALKHTGPVTDEHVPDADVVVATWWETAEWVADLSPSKGAKAYFVQHYEIHQGQPVRRVKSTWTLPMHKIAVASWLADVAAREFGDHDVSVVPNAVDTEHFTAEPRGKQVRPTVGVMYSPEHYKGCDICLAACDIARREVPDLHLVSFGVRAEPEKLPLPEGAEFTAQPRQSVLPRIYASCDAWLFGSRTEGFGLPVLEAMACRTPVIATPAGAAPDLLAEGGGILLDGDDPAEMARAIRRIASLPDGRWRDMSEKAREIATRYSWNDAARLFEAALRRAIERSSADGRSPNEKLRSAGA